MQIEFVDQPGADQTQEEFTVTLDDGRVERMRIHEYGRVYAVPGLYEAVVQDRLQCASPDTLAQALADAVAAAGGSVAELAALDLGAGNGLVGEKLRERGVRGTLIGQDAEPEAAPATERDRPGVYAEFLQASIETIDVAALVQRHGLNALVGAGALGMGHVTRAQIEHAWQAIGSGGWLAVTFHEDVLTDAGGELRDFVEAQRAEGSGVSVHRLERFRHRLTMAGAEIRYYVLVARRD